MWTVFYLILIGLAFVGVGLGVLWLVNRHWGLQLSTTHVGFFQAWIYVLQTIALVATVSYIGVQSGEVQRTIRANTVQLMVTAHRELLGKILEQPELHRKITSEELPADPSSRVYMSMIFNHGFNAFALREECFIDDDWWSAITRDMRDVIRHGGMRKRWESIKEFYPLRYQSFIDRRVLGEGKEERTCGS